MSVHDLTISVVSTGDTIYDPLTVTSDVLISLRVTNNGSDDLTDLGLFVEPTTTLGDVDEPADYPPETDFQDLLTWGTNTDDGTSTAGGILVDLPQTGGGTVASYITRTQGSLKSNKLAIADIAAGASIDFDLTLETPDGVTARRLYANIVIE